MLPRNGSNVHIFDGTNISGGKMPPKKFNKCSNIWWYKHFWRENASQEICQMFKYLMVQTFLKGECLAENLSNVQIFYGTNISEGKMPPKKLFKCSNFKYFMVQTFLEEKYRPTMFSNVQLFDGTNISEERRFSAPQEQIFQIVQEQIFLNISRTNIWGHKHFWREKVLRPSRTDQRPRQEEVNWPCGEQY